MSSLEMPYRGRVQAQGDDIHITGGYSHSWAENLPVTEQQGLSFIDKIEKQCTSAQIAERKTAFQKARRFVRNASKQGGVGPEAQPYSFQDRNPKVHNARVDIEIAKGLTFVPDVPRETQ